MIHVIRAFFKTIEISSHHYKFLGNVRFCLYVYFLQGRLNSIIEKNQEEGKHSSFHLI